MAEKENNSSAWSLFFLAWAITATFLLALMFYGFQMPRYQYCENAGFKNANEKAAMQTQINDITAQITAAQERLASCGYSSDKLKEKLILADKNQCCVNCQGLCIGALGKLIEGAWEK
jgi:hypothetical protein